MLSLSSHEHLKKFQNDSATCLGTHRYSVPSDHIFRSDVWGELFFWCGMPQNVAVNYFN